MIAPSEQPSLFVRTKIHRSGKRVTRRAKIPATLTTGVSLDVTLGKHYVLDTNVLLHDPGCLYRFEDNHLVVPGAVLAELDRFKGEQSDRGANARAVHRELSQLFGQDSKQRMVATLPSGGTVSLALYDTGDPRFRPDSVQCFERTFPDQEHADHRILACALVVEDNNPTPVILVTKDLNLQLKARAVGLPCEDYLSDRVDEADAEDYAMPEILVDGSALQRLGSSGELELEEAKSLTINQYVILYTDQGKELAGVLEQGLRMKSDRT